MASLMFVRAKMRQKRLSHSYDVERGWMKETGRSRALYKYHAESDQHCETTFQQL